MALREQSRPGGHPLRSGDRRCAGLGGARARSCRRCSPAVQRNSRRSRRRTCSRASRAPRRTSGRRTSGISQLLPWGGGTYTRRSRRGADDDQQSVHELQPAARRRPEADLLAAAAARLQDRRGAGPARHQPANRELADIRFRETTRQHQRQRRGRRTGRWCRRWRSVDVQQRSLDLALELERNNRARVDVGQSPPLDLVAARAEVAQRQENLIVARTTALQAEDVAAHADHRSQARRLLDWSGSNRPIATPVVGADAGRRYRGPARAGRADGSRAGPHRRFRSTTPTSRCRRARRCPICACRRAISATAPAARG